MYEKCFIIVLYIPIVYAFTCGHSNIPRNLRIINGTEPQPHSWPWIVTIQHPLIGHFCGGSLIDANYVISAAHCFFSIFFHSSIIYIGNHYLNDRIEQRTISEVICHPSYNSTTGDPNDIVLLKLNQSVDINVYPPICLSTPDTVPLELPGQNVIVAGWGATDPGTLKPSNVLLQTTLKIHNQSIPECQPYINDTNKQLCVGIIGGGTGSCSGDSGGPLMAQYENQYYLIGIVSAGIGGCGNTSSLYIRIRAFIYWICMTDPNIVYCSSTTSTTSLPITDVITRKNVDESRQLKIILGTVLPGILIIGILITLILWKRKKLCFS